jgi:CRP/FNR family transcriptional regulator, cyclic AMP receptor protein
MARRSQAEIVGVLEGVPLFGSLTKRQLRAVAGECSGVAYEPDDVIVKELDTGQHLVCLVSGGAKVVRNGRTIARLAAGDVVGEMALLDGEPRSASVVATEPTTGIALYQTAFRKLLADHPTMCSKLLLSMSARLRESDKRLGLYG